ncbi:glycosyltransferase 87 family protein [Streptomyces sp. AC495_CC817]|uniref:glycosyltransferase 87 family protein n=1 Tax=Streptomyces sp. AC495_CC817 TaxID=2823900 RepID=UPI001C2675E5|nr:glycosyltransferase 87 family protein [Streptomyces sp. AC495_CC817]
MGRSRLVALWGAFLAVHAVTAIVGWVYPSQPMGDVVLVYEPWSASALSGGPIVGVTETWVYPQLALLPMLLAKILSLPLVAALGASSAYLVAWAAMVVVLDAVAFGVLLGRAPSQPRRAAAWFWCGALLLLGPIGLYRIDAVTVPIAVIGGLWISRRPAVGAALLAIGAWIKIWPGALVLAAFVAFRARVRILIAAASVTAAVVVTLLLLGADTEILGFLTEQTGRGLQIESVAATPFLWLAVGGAARIEYSFEILTFQIAATGADAVGAVLTPLMLLLVLAIAVLGAVKAARGADHHRLFPPLALALVTALIVANKVGSPQFQTWLLAPVILWLVLDRTRARVPAVLVLVLCALTCLVYPLAYDGLLRAELLPVLVLTLRNALLIVLLVVGVRALARVPAHRTPTTRE